MPSILFRDRLLSNFLLSLGSVTTTAFDAFQVNTGLFPWFNFLSSNNKNNSNLALNELAWKQKTSINEGLEKAIKWYEANC